MRLYVLPLLLVLAACDKAPPPAPATATSGAAKTAAVAPPTSTASAAAALAVAKLVDGAKLAALLPTAANVGSGATDRVDRPAKEGYAEAVYKKGKDDLVTITITDTTGVPAVRDDYKDSQETVAGFPLKTSGYTKSSALISNRYQVQVQSPRLKAPERKALIEKLDLKALGAVN
jgi:hypothetical protein